MIPAVVIAALPLYAGFQYARFRSVQGFWSRPITPHLRLGPTLFIILAAATTYLGYWWPVTLDRQFSEDVDSRITWVVSGFAPVTTGTAILGIFAYIRLIRIQKKSPGYIGWILLAILPVPLAWSVYIGAILLRSAIFFLPSLVKELLLFPLTWF